MKQKIITVKINRAKTREEERAQRVEAAVRLAILIATAATLFVAGICAKINLAQEQEKEAEVAAPVVMEESLRLAPVKTPAAELEDPTPAVEEDSVEPTVPADVWDTPLSASELAVLLEVCEAHHIAPALALGLIEVESSFRWDAVNQTSGCYGYCQLNPAYFPGGLSPEDNIRTGIGYLAEKLERYGELEAGLTAYNAGYDTGHRGYAGKVLAAAERWETK